MAAKKQVYITAELDWAETKLAEWKKYIDDNPIHQMTDRMDYKETKSGGLVKTVIANIEAQVKSQRETMKEYLLLLEQVGKMREVEAAKAQEGRGGAEVPFRMRGK